mgnify:CR=1 FL=1
MFKTKRDFRLKKYTFANFISTVELTKPGAVRPDLSARAYTFSNLLRLFANADLDHPLPVLFTGLRHETFI